MLLDDAAVVGAVGGDSLVSGGLEFVCMWVLCAQSGGLCAQPVASVVPVAEHHGDFDVIVQHVLEIGYVFTRGVTGTYSESRRVEGVNIQYDVRAISPV